MNLLLIFTFYYKYLNIEIIYNLGNKIVLFLICIRINGFVWNAKRKSGTTSVNTGNKRLVLHMRPRCGSLSATTPVSLLANESMFEAYCTGK